MADIAVEGEASSRRRGVQAVRSAVAALGRCLARPCPLCEGRTAEVLCGVCQDDLLRALPAGTRRCGRCALRLPEGEDCPDCRFLRPAFDRVVTAFDYRFPGDLLVHGLKSEHRFTHAPALARLITLALGRQGLRLPREAILLPVPSAPAALRRRGFNPAAEIARSLARQLALPCRVGWLLRHPGAGPQKRLGRVDRAREAASLYYCGRRLDGCHIVLVDDVMTTGSTLHGAALAVRAAGAVSVNGLVAARTPRGADPG